GEELVERRRLALRKPEQIALRSGMKPAQARQDLVPDQPALRLAVRPVRAELEPFGATVRLGLLAPDREQRTHDSVFPARLDSPGNTARNQPVQHRLDLVGGRVARRPQAISVEGVTNVAPLVLRRAAAAVDDPGAEVVGAEA